MRCILPDKLYTARRWQYLQAGCQRTRPSAPAAGYSQHLRPASAAGDSPLLHPANARQRAGCGSCRRSRLQPASRFCRVRTYARRRGCEVNPPRLPSPDATLPRMFHFACRPGTSDDHACMRAAQRNRRARAAITRATCPSQRCKAVDPAACHTRSMRRALENQEHTSLQGTACLTLKTRRAVPPRAQ